MAGFLAALFGFGRFGGFGGTAGWHSLKIGS
jgi:hypothetical protein